MYIVGYLCCGRGSHIKDIRAHVWECLQADKHALEIERAHLVALLEETQVWFLKSQFYIDFQSKS